MTLEEKIKRLWRCVYSTEIEYGSRLLATKTDKKLYVVLGATNEVVPLPARGGDKLFGYLYEMYGLRRGDKNAEAMYELFRLHAINEGLTVELKRLAAYDPATQTAFVSGYDGTMWRVDGEQVSSVQNGSEGVFFLDDDGGVACEPEIANHGLLLDTVTNLNYEPGPGGITPEQQRKFMIVWLFALSFPELLPDKPVMLLEGIKGSGKTSAIKLIQFVLQGNARIMGVSKDQEKDFGVVLLRAPIAIIDNVDTYIEWLQDKICQFVTDGKFPKRKLFSDDDEIVVKPNSFIAVTSRNPTSFRRDDVVDRLLIIRLKRYLNFKTQQNLDANVREQRPQLLGEYLYWLNQIVIELRNGALDQNRQEKWRMASFAGFSRVIGKVFGWPDEEITSLLDVMQTERDIFEGEGDPLVELVTEWVTYKGRNQPRNIGREVPLSDLFKELYTLAKAKEILFYKHHSRLIEKLESNYIAKHFRIECRYDDNTGARYYKIWRHSDLVGIDGGLEMTDPPIETPDPHDKPLKVIRIVKGGVSTTVT